MLRGSRCVKGDRNSAELGVIVTFHFQRNSIYLIKYILNRIYTKFHRRKLNTRDLLSNHNETTSRDAIPLERHWSGKLKAGVIAEPVKPRNKPRGQSRANLQRRASSGAYL